MTDSLNSWIRNDKLAPYRFIIRRVSLLASTSFFCLTRILKRRSGRCCVYELIVRVLSSRPVLHTSDQSSGHSRERIAILSLSPLRRSLSMRWPTWRNTYFCALRCRNSNGRYWTHVWRTICAIKTANDMPSMRCFARLPNGLSIVHIMMMIDIVRFWPD